jgi:hypothetical protein
MEETNRTTSLKLRSAGYSIRSLKSIMSLKSLRTIYFSYVHSTMLYGIIFWGISLYSNFMFKITKIIIMNAGYRDSWHPPFKMLNILPLYSQYIFSLSIFVVTNFFFICIHWFILHNSGQVTTIYKPCQQTKYTGQTQEEHRSVKGHHMNKTMYKIWAYR